MRITLRDRLRPLYASIDRSGRKKFARPYNFKPHDGIRAKLRRCRQAAYYQLPPEQFRTSADWIVARRLYFEVVEGQRGGHAAA